ncbi:MAG: DUF2130 domain-containing protein [Campylobacteraceae bacterium]|nr:DUF2130 domain-containing protein [Campylobacteraceae bacterium]
MSLIKCPNCNSQIDIGKLQDKELRAEYNSKFLALKKEFEEKRAKEEREYKNSLQELEKQKAKFDEALKEQLNLALAKEKESLENSIKAKFESENLAKLKALESELVEKSQKINEFNKQSAEHEALKRKMAEMEAEYSLKTQKLINETLQSERDKISKQIHEENELKFKQFSVERENLIKQIDELKRKSEISSQQLQGEIQELAIEEYLKTNFPLDDIDEVKKGVNGADTIQTINEKELFNCGKILYESKRTKAFSNEWIEKLKVDMRECGANVGVIVTQTMPKELDRIGLINGVWVCSFEEFKGLCAVLRQGLIDLAYVNKANQNRGSKMDLLYNYLTSNEFKMQVLAIVDSFTAMQQNLIREQNSMKRIWKEREKLIEKARDSAIEMHSSIKTIAGNEIEAIEILELPFSDGEED